MSLAVLSIDLVAQLAKLESGLDKAGRLAEKQASQMERAFSGVRVVAAGIGGVIAGAFSVAAVEQFFTSTINGIDALNDLADATGASIENISALEDVALRTGSSFDTVSTALVKLNDVLKEAKPGSVQAETLKAIGLSAEELKRIDPAEAMLKVAQALAKFADDGNKARIVQELFGKSIREVAPFLKDLAEKGKLNGTVTREQAEAADAFNKELAKLSKNITDVSRSVIGDMLPSLNRALDVWKELGTVGAIRFNMGRSPFENQLTEFQKVRDELAKKQEELANFVPSRGIYGTSNDAQREKLKADVTDLEKLVKVRGMLLGLDDSAGAGRGGAAPGLPAAPDVIDPKKDRPKKVERLIDGLPVDRVEAFRQSELAATARVNEALATSRLTEAELDLAHARYLSDTQTNATAEWREKLNNAELDRLEKLAEEQKEVHDKMTAFAEEAARNIQDALGDAVFQTLEGDFDNIGESWKRMLNRMAAEAIAADLNNALFGGTQQSFTGALGGGLGGAFGSIAGAIGTYFGATDPSSAYAVNGSDFGFDISAALPSYDVGTPYVPEDQIALIHKGERIIPASQNRPGAAGYGSDVRVKLAEGTNFVPFDGMPATLHRGEAVVPAKYNPANGGSSGGVVIHNSPQIYIDGRMDQATTAQLITQALQANNRALEERMQAQGRR
jgi:hypothetical protein